ncbi:MAG TPA: type II toxin-antitoxin system VapC family toxin [Patescibacteria group bacterium]|nr:type II toxin-antitoxin system VapC family toxin [Patescibacteria group bacterium]
MKVVDASIIVKLLIEEDGSAVVRELVKKEEMVVPDLLFIEVANTLATKTRLSPVQVKEGLELVYELGLRVENTDKKLLVEAAAMAKQKGTAVYDMLYAVLAKRLGVELMTADRKFVSRTKFDFVKLLDA